MGKNRSTFWGVLALLAASASGVLVAGRGSRPAAPAARLRRPVAAALLEGDTLCVANQRSGSLSLVDLRQSRVREEVPVGGRLADMAVLPDRRHLLAVDEKRNELVALAADGPRPRVRARLAVGPYPVSVAVQADGKRATVASLWSRRVEVVDLTPLSRRTGPVRLRVLHTVRLPFAPRLQCALPGRPEVVVADSFGGRLAVVDAAAGRLVTVHTLTGHNLRGLAVSPDGKRLLLSHQVLDQKAPTTRDNIRGGVLMANVLRLLPLDRVLAPRADLDAAGRVVRLGGVGAGAGDPTGVAFVGQEEVAVALAGVDEAALLGVDGKSARRLPVGRRPTAVLALGPGRPVVVLNTFDDSLALLDPAKGRVTGTISLGPQPALASRDRGELLFHDARLAADRWLSCHSCHPDGHTNGLLADTLGDNTYGTPKQVLTLMNTALTDPWAWNGEMKYLQDQVRKSLADTMHTRSVTPEQVGDLVSFLHTLPPPPPPEPATGDRADRESVERGRRVFQERGCVRCHIPPLTYTSGGTYDVGFADERGHRTFNPPSLRGVGQAYCFLHDNRAATLEEVFTRFRHKVGPGLPADDLADLLRFLRSL